MNNDWKDPVHKYCGYCIRTNRCASIFVISDWNTIILTWKVYRKMINHHTNGIHIHISYNTYLDLIDLTLQAELILRHPGCGHILGHMNCLELWIYMLFFEKSRNMSTGHWMSFSIKSKPYTLTEIHLSILKSMIWWVSLNSNQCWLIKELASDGMGWMDRPGQQGNDRE